MTLAPLPVSRDSRRFQQYLAYRDEFVPWIRD